MDTTIFSYNVEGPYATAALGAGILYMVYDGSAVTNFLFTASSIAKSILPVGPVPDKTTLETNVQPLPKTAPVVSNPLINASEIDSGIAVVEEKKKEETPRREVDASSELIATPPKVIATPPKVIATPPKVIATPPKESATPPKVIATDLEISQASREELSSSPIEDATFSILSDLPPREVETNKMDAKLQEKKSKAAATDPLTSAAGSAEKGPVISSTSIKTAETKPAETKPEAPKPTAPNPTVPKPATTKPVLTKPSFTPSRDRMWSLVTMQKTDSFMVKRVRNVAKLVLILLSVVTMFIHYVICPQIIDRFFVSNETENVKNFEKKKVKTK